jgi:hypothetical protein
MDLSAASLAPLGIVAGAIVLFFLPVIVAAARRTENMGLVVLLTVLGVGAGITWFAAWYAVFALPPRPAAPRYHPAGRRPA